MKRAYTRQLLLVLASGFASTAHAAFRFSGDGELVDVVAECDDAGLRVWVAEKPSNAPFEGDVSIQKGSSAEAVKLTKDKDAGVYTQAVSLCPASADEAVQLIVTRGEDNDIIPLSLEKPAGSQQVAEPAGHKDSLPWGLLMVALALGMVIGASIFFLTQFLIKKGQSAALLLLGLAAIGTTQPAWAHEGHEHAPSPSSDAPSVGGQVTLAKKSQFLIGVRSMKAETRKIRSSVITYGHLHPKPQLDAQITAPQSGVVRVADQIALGQAVRKGQVLGSLDALAHIPLVSPIDGLLIELDAVTGLRVDTGAKLFRVSATAKLWVDAEVFESDLPAVSKSSQVKVLVDGKTDPVMGTIMSRATPLSEETRTAKFYVEVDNADGSLRIGSFSTVYFMGNEETDAITLPKGAVLTRGGEQIVMIQTGAETFKAVNVLTAKSSEPGTFRILSGIQNGDRVVVSGNYQLLSKVK